MDSTPGLKRHIGLLALVLYGVGDILGAGIYGLVGKAAGEMGSAVWLAFLASLVAAGLTGLSYASLASRYPRSAGASYITFRAFGNGCLSYVIGLAVLASGLTSMATASRVFAGYLGVFLPTAPPTLLAIGFALLLAGIVLRGIRESMGVNALCTVIEVSGLLVVIVVGLPWLGGIDYLDAQSPHNPSGDLTMTLVLSGAVLTFYSFLGFEDMLNIAEEVRNPRRNLPLGLIIAVCVASLIYMMICLIAVSVIPASELSGSSQPLVDVVHKAAPWFPTSIYSVVALFAVANTALLNFVMGSRLLYGMASQGLLPPGLARIHARRHTPHVAIGVTLGIFILLIVSGDITSLARATSVLLLGCFAIVNFTLVVLQRRERFPGTFEVPAIIPLTGSGICLAMISQAKGPELTTAAVIIAVILALYAIMRPRPDAIADMES